MHWTFFCEHPFVLLRDIHDNAPVPYELSCIVPAPLDMIFETNIILQNLRDMGGEHLTIDISCTGSDVSKFFAQTYRTADTYHIEVGLPGAKKSRIYAKEKQSYAEACAFFRKMMLGELHPEECAADPSFHELFY